MSANLVPPTPKAPTHDDRAGLGHARTVTAGGVVTLSAALPMTADNLARLMAAWRFEPLPAGPRDDA